MVLATYPHTSSGDAWAPCDSPSHIGTSNHHAERAWDWFIAPEGTRASAEQRAAPDELIEWLLAPEGGIPHMRARRLGIVEIIWFDQIWQSRTRIWRTYPLQGCPDPNANNTGCHRDHVHFGFSVAGADGHTTWWRGLEGWVLSTAGWIIDLAGIPRR